MKVGEVTVANTIVAEVRISCVVVEVAAYSITMDGVVIVDTVLVISTVVVLATTGTEKKDEHRLKAAWFQKDLLRTGCRLRASTAILCCATREGVDGET